MLDVNTPRVDWLGDIAVEDGRYLTMHENGTAGYHFDEFRLAIRYFEEYAFALSLGGSSQNESSLSIT